MKKKIIDILIFLAELLIIDLKILPDRIGRFRIIDTLIATQEGQYGQD